MLTEVDMPPRGVKSAKRARQYEHIKESAKKQGRSTKRAKQIAAATVNKQRREAGQTKTTSTRKRSTKKTAKKGAAKKTTRKSSTRKSSTRRSSSKKR